MNSNNQKKTVVRTTEKNIFNQRAIVSEREFAFLLNLV